MQKYANSVAGRLVGLAHTNRLAVGIPNTADLAVAGIVDAVVADCTDQAAVDIAAAGIAAGSGRAVADTMDIDQDSGWVAHRHLPAADMGTVALLAGMSLWAAPCSCHATWILPRLNQL